MVVFRHEHSAERIVKISSCLTNARIPCESSSRGLKYLQIVSQLCHIVGNRTIATQRFHNTAREFFQSEKPIEFLAPKKLPTLFLDR